MPPMCPSCPDVNKLRGMDTTILGQHRPFMSIKSFVQHSGWQEMVSLCSLIRLIGMCADRDRPEFLCSRSDSRYLEVHVATAGGLLTRYRSREVRNSIYRYLKIHIDYRSKFLYRFISPISIIYGNTNLNRCWLSMKPLQTNLSEIWIKIQNFSIMKMHSIMLSAKCLSFCLGPGICPSRNRKSHFPGQYLVNQGNWANGVKALPIPHQQM